MGSILVESSFPRIPAAERASSAVGESITVEATFSTEGDDQGGSDPGTWMVGRVTRRATLQSPVTEERSCRDTIVFRCSVLAEDTQTGRISVNALSLRLNVETDPRPAPVTQPASHETHIVDPGQRVLACCEASYHLADPSPRSGSVTPSGFPVRTGRPEPESAVPNSQRR